MKNPFAYRIYVRSPGAKRQFALGAGPGGNLIYAEHWPTLQEAAKYAEELAKANPGFTFTPRRVSK